MLSNAESHALSRTASATEKTHELLARMVKKHDDDRAKNRVVLESISKTITAGFGHRDVGLLPKARFEVWVDPTYPQAAFVDIHYTYCKISTLMLNIETISAPEIAGVFSDEIKEHTQRLIEQMQWIDKIYAAVAI